MKSAFGSYHPIVNFTYFCSVIILGMFLMHPVFLTIGAAAAASYTILLNGKKGVKFILCFILPMIAAVSIMNPIFVHKGSTILFYLRDNPVTMEALVYGIASGFMFATILLWFSCYNVIMTSDKFVYLFGRAIPAMSLIFSMVLRFVPRFRAQIVIVSQAQKCVGRDVSNGNLADKVANGLKILSIMVTWALENAIDTAESMKSRGYGLKGRTAFSIYRFDARDSAAALTIALILGILFLGLFFGSGGAQYYPFLRFGVLTPATAVVYGGYFILCFLPILLDIKEAIRWRHSQLRI